MLLKPTSTICKHHIFHPSHGTLSRKRGAGTLFFACCLIGTLLLSACGSTSSDGMSHDMSSMSAPSSTPAVAEADLSKTPAPDFRLQDQHGKEVSLTQMKGKVVALTFWYTHCPDTCPLSAEKFRQALEALGKNADQVAILAVSVDPANDTAASARQFSQAHRLAPYANWHFLLGTQQQLQPVWKDYRIYTDASQTSPQGQAINHMAIIYLIDKQGRERKMLPTNFTPPQLTRNLNALLQEG